MGFVGTNDLHGECGPYAQLQAKYGLDAAASAQAAAQSARDARQAAESLTGLPAVTEADNGKFLRVAGGVWAAEAVPSAEEVSS